MSQLTSLGSELSMSRLTYALALGAQLLAILVIGGLTVALMIARLMA